MDFRSVEDKCSKCIWSSQIFLLMHAQLGWTIHHFICTFGLCPGETVWYFSWLFMWMCTVVIFCLIPLIIIIRIMFKKTKRKEKLLQPSILMQKSHLQKCTTFCSVFLAPVACLRRCNYKIKSNVLRAKIPTAFLAEAPPVAFCCTATSIYQFPTLQNIII